MKIPLLKLDSGLPTPGHAQPGDAGTDLYARSSGKLEPGERETIATGVAVAIPPGHVGLVAPRSGLAARSGISIVNAPGIIDAGFRGEIHVIAANLGDATFRYERGDRIGQLVVVPFVEQHFEIVDELPDSVRGDGGFGSTGM